MHKKLSLHLPTLTLMMLTSCTSTMHLNPLPTHLNQMSTIHPIMFHLQTFHTTMKMIWLRGSIMRNITMLELSWHQEYDNPHKTLKISIATLWTKILNTLFQILFTMILSPRIIKFSLRKLVTLHNLHHTLKQVNYKYRNIPCLKNFKHWRIIKHGN